MSYNVIRKRRPSCIRVQSGIKESLKGAPELFGALMEETKDHLRGIK